MSAVLALDVSETLMQSSSPRPCHHPVHGGGVNSCMVEGCASWEYGVSAYSWRKGDPVYPDGAA